MATRPLTTDDGEDEDEDDEAEVTGTVSGATAGHACPYSFNVGTMAVTTTATPRFDDTTSAGVVNDITVEAAGTRTSPTVITTTRVEKKVAIGRPFDASCGHAVRNRGQGPLDVSRPFRG